MRFPSSFSVCTAFGNWSVNQKRCFLYRGSVCINMKKVFKFVKGKKDEKKESGGITPSQSGDLISPAQTPEDERFLCLDNTSGGYYVDFSGKDKTLTKLHKAAWQGNLEKLKSALKKVEIDAPDRHNRTALHFAVVQGHPNIVWFLLGNNAVTSICDDEGRTPLLKAIECNHKECLKVLLERGADVNIADYTGNTGLHIAVKQGSVDTVSALLAKAVNIEVSNNAGDYPLHIATKAENKELVDLLLNAGAEVNVQDRENRTPLMLAAKNGNTLLTDVFVESGATLNLVDSNGWTADDYALLGGHETIASSLKALIRDKKEKSKENRGAGQSDSLASTTTTTTEDKSKKSWDDTPSEKSNKNDQVSKKIKEIFKTHSKEAQEASEREKDEETSESPSAQVIPPFCQPPRSWDMIQAGMIDGNRPGIETKRLSLTALGTLRSRRESFTEGMSSTSPKHTLSLNRRKGAKVNNSFAKQRLSFNEEISLKNLTGEEPLAKESGEVNFPAKLDTFKVASKKGETSSESDWDSDPKAPPPDSSSDWDSTEKDGTLGRSDTMKELEEIWVNSSKDGNFPPPPSALELGADMAKSLKYMKGISEDYPLGSSVVERNLWKSAYETHSLDCLEEKNGSQMTRAESLKEDFRYHPSYSQRWKSQELPNGMDVNKRINEQLECYDQALRELAQTSTSAFGGHSNSVNYYSLPSSKGRARDDASQKNGKEKTSGPSSAPPLVGETVYTTAEKYDNDEKLGLEKTGPINKDKRTEGTDRKTKRDILMAMRDVKHAIHVSSALKTSFDDQILSPLTKPDDSFDMSDESSPKSSQDKVSPPANGTAFFALGRQETVLERKSSSSGTADEPTLWLQNDVQAEGHQNGSVEDVSEISEERAHRRESSFSPLGVIYREIQIENQNAVKAGTGSVKEKREEDGEYVGGEDYHLREDQAQLFSRKDEAAKDQSPDISLSSGPIDPLGAEKDSGSDPESSHNDITPAHHYTLKDQHEWLKRHLKTATSEKNKLEEIAAQLSEKAERLQYELADAKEATKSRDEVIKLLQEQLSRMETAYTKSLEESVQSQLQLTSHQQEILHLRELCYKYEEEKMAETEGNNLDKLEIKIKRLEGEKEKMKEEIAQLETEKTSLVKRLKEVTETEIIDQCQRWKERFEKEEQESRGRTPNKSGCDCDVVGERDRRELQERNAQLEKKLLEITEENLELSSNYQRLVGEIESEKKMFIAKKEINDSISELQRKNSEMETYVRRLEKELEDKTAKVLKEKEKEIQFLLKQFTREKDSLVKIYEGKLTEKKTEECREDRCRKETERLREVIRNLQDQMKALEAKNYVENAKKSLENEIFEVKDQCDHVTKSVAEIQNRDVNFLLRENMNLKKAISEIKIDLPKEGSGIDFKDKYVELACENVKMKNLILDLKNQVNTLSLMVETEGRRVSEAAGGGETGASSLERRERQRVEDVGGSGGHRTGGRRRVVGVDDHLAWTNLYGIKSLEQTRSWKSEREEEGDEKEGKQLENGRDSIDKLELKKLKREIAFLQNKMADEKALREALENQINEINRDLKEKEILQQEIYSLKKKINRDYIQKFDLELVQYQKELQEKRQKYLEEGEKTRSLNDEAYKTKCQILAKEREKSKEIRNKIWTKTKLPQYEITKNPGEQGLPSMGAAPSAAAPSHIGYPSLPLADPEILAQTQYGHSKPLLLESAIKTQLERELDKSIKRHRAGTSSSRPLDLLNEAKNLP